MQEREKTTKAASVLRGFSINGITCRGRGGGGGGNVIRAGRKEKFKILKASKLDKLRDRWFPHCDALLLSRRNRVMFLVNSDEFSEIRGRNEDGENSHCEFQ